MKSFANRVLVGIQIGLGVLIPILLVMGGILLADSLNVFQANQVVSASQLNANFQQLNANFTKLPPIGAILPWHKSLSGAPTLPDGWVECDGSPINDSESPFNGQATPNLNNPVNAWNSRGVFLRGHTASGIFENDAFQGHYHRMEKDSNIHEWFLSTTNFALVGGGADSGRNGVTTTGYRAREAITGANGAPRFGMETVAVNMSVVWVMRIK